MKIIRERPCQRRHHRVSAPMKVTLPSGETKTATNWSLGGLRLDDLSTAPPKCGEEIELLLELPFQGFDISFEVTATVTRSKKKKKMLGVEFIELSERARDLMEHFINDLVRGQMATIDDTICRIDVPVTPISTEPDKNPKEDMPIKRWPVKTIVMSCFYICLGISVFTYLGVLIYSNVMRMEIETAVVSSQLQTLKMPVHGTIEPVRMNQGTIVKKGQLLARISSKDLERELEAKQIEFADKNRHYQLALRKYEIESQRMEIYEMVSKADLQISHARMEAAKAGLKAADNNVKRISNLESDSAQLKLQEALNQQEQAEARMREAQLIHEKATATSAISNRKYFGGEGIIADLDLLTLEIDAANNALDKLQMEIAALEREKDGLVIRAPFSGKILKAANGDSFNFVKDQEVLTIQKQQLPVIHAFLSQKQVLSVGMHDDASIYLPSLGKTVSGRVTKIDRNQGHIDGTYSNFIWRENEAKSAMVSLELNPEEVKQKEINAGLPAIVIFSKRTTNNIYNAIGDVVTEVAEVFNDDNSV